ncbi:MAG: hypothetical protein ABSA97_10495 [Verrucomicrobiia bacterium]
MNSRIPQSHDRQHRQYVRDGGNEFTKAGRFVYPTGVKVVGDRIAETPAEYLVQLRRMRERLDRWNPYPRPRGQVFKFRTWEDLEKWRQSQTNPRLR